MNKISARSLTGLILGCAGVPAFGAEQIQAVPLADVRLADTFWSPRLETTRTVTLPYVFRKCEETGRVDNFLRAAHALPPPHTGNVYDDTDIYKAIEGAAYSLKEHPDPGLEDYVDGLVAKIAAAQEPDGYLYTPRTVDPSHPQEFAGKTRWSEEQWSHEFYCSGHLYEAAVAYYACTGRRNFLDVAIKNADLLVRSFGNGPGQTVAVSGHEEVEIGLARLAGITGDARYLNLARFFIDHRGRLEGRKALWGVYWQDDRPVLEQTGPEGHAVRALYLYNGMADVALASPDAGAYVAALDRIWDSFVGRRIYLTGGPGARHHGEAFGDDFELPNDTAYNETCAAVAAAMWQREMFLLHGESKYVDVLERILYNGMLSGISLSGDRFFYANPLSSDGHWPFNAGEGGATRAGWFSTPCCPTNLCRFLPSLPGYIYAVGPDSIYVNLFVSSDATTEVGKVRVELAQLSDAPWGGRVSLTVSPDTPCDFAIRVRVPGWAFGRPIPSSLYTYMDAQGRRLKSREEDAAAIPFLVNGEPVPATMEQGYAVIRRTWRAGDRVEVEFPMRPRRVLGNMSIDAALYRVAIEKGPLVYCAEGIDNGGHVLQRSLRDDAALEVLARPKLLGGIEAIEARSPDATTTLIPYYAWSNRGVGEMAVWFLRK
jgi:uncharacterized protein